MVNDRTRIYTELNRISTRVSGLNLTRLESCAHLIHSCAQEILHFTPDAHTTLPVVGPSGVSAQLTVITRNYLELTETDSAPARDSDVADLLTQLRRDLP